MKNVTSLVAAGAFLAHTFVAVAWAHGKPLPPAFGKELVPDEAKQERNQEKAADLDEEKAAPKKVRSNSQRAPTQLRGKKLHIELDGDEDGGGVDDDLESGGEF